ESLETLKAWLALGVDLAAVIRLALVSITDDFVGSVELGEARGRLGIVLVGVGVQFFGETPIGALDLSFIRTLGNPQHLVGVAHRIRSPMKSPAAGESSGQTLHQCGVPSRWMQRASLFGLRRAKRAHHSGSLPRLECADFPLALPLSAGFALQ